MIIYKITNLINGKEYIGQHSCNRSYYFGSGIVLKDAIKKYGRENFRKEVIGYAFDKGQLDWMEKFYIQYYDTKAPKGYNLTEGGEGMFGYRHNEETRKKLSKALKGKKQSLEWIEKRTRPNIGKKRTEETKRKMREARKGFKPTDKTKKRLSESHKGHFPTEETRLKMSESHRSRWKKIREE